MPSRELRIHPAAILEIAETRIWYERIDPVLGERYSMELQLAVQAAFEAPARWPADERGRRTCRLQVFPYAIVYEWNDPIVLILAVAHGSRRPGYWRERDR